MARTVTYSVVPRINPREKNDPPKYYAQAQARGDVSLREMAERIQSTCTVTKADVYAVLVSLEDVVKDAIENGEIVRLGDLCTLQVGLSGANLLDGFFSLFLGEIERIVDLDGLSLKVLTVSGDK